MHKKSKGESGSEHGSDSDYDSFYTEEDSGEAAHVNVDLSNYYTKEECQRFVREEIIKVANRIEQEQKEDYEKLKSLIGKANDRINQENKYTRSVEKMVDDIDKQVEVRQQKLTAHLEMILKQNQREKSDL